MLTIIALSIFLGRSLPGWLVTAEAGHLVTVSVAPAHDFRFSRMQVGVLQHVDREYTYDRVPDELLNGFIFQGIHRPPRGTRLTFTLRSPATVYFFFHHKVDGGYGKIFEGLSAWKRLETYPQYDIHNGDHGLTMVMYRLDAEGDPGYIPFQPPPKTMPASTWCPCHATDRAPHNQRF